MQKDTQSKLSKNTIMLHWLVALFMVVLLATGIYMQENEVYALYPWHKSFGVLIILLVTLRIVWRYMNGWPTKIRQYQSWEIRLSKIVQYLLIIGTAIMPISGFLMSALGGHGVALFGLELVARNPNPANPQEVVPLNGSIAGLAHEAHWIAGYTIIAALALHIAGALKHHVIDKDGTLRRMLGSNV